MDEILLTPEEIKPIVARFMKEWKAEWKRWPVKKERTRPWTDSLNEAICRAQVAKVDTVLFVPWIQKLKTQWNLAPEGEYRARLDTSLVVLQAAQQALRAAAGMEGGE